MKNLRFFTTLFKKGLLSSTCGCTLLAQLINQKMDMPVPWEGYGALNSSFTQSAQICVVAVLFIVKRKISPDFFFKGRGAFDVCSEYSRHYPWKNGILKGQKDHDCVWLFNSPTALSAVFFLFLRGLGNETIENNAKGTDTSLTCGIAEMRFAESGGVCRRDAGKGGRLSF